MDVLNNIEIIIFLVFECVLLFFILYTYVAVQQVVMNIFLMIVLSIIGSVSLLYGYVTLEESYILLSAIMLFVVFTTIFKIIDDCTIFQAIYISSIITILYYILYIIIYYFMFYQLSTLSQSNYIINFLSLFATQICLLGVYSLDSNFFVIGIGKKASLISAFSMTIMLVIPSFLNISPDMATWNFMYFITLLFIGFMCVLGIVIVYILLKTEKKLSIEKQYHFTEQLDTLYQRQLIKEKDNLHKIRHDLENNIIIIQKLIVLGEKDEALRYIHSITRKIVNTENKIFTNIIILDAYINYIVSQHLDIKFKISSNDLSSVTLEYSDILLLIMNLVDNAVENIGLPKIINISLLYKDNQLLMKVSNTTTNNPYLHSFKSTKKNTNYHGYGLQIVNDIIKQYSAKCIKEYINGCYNVYITFDLEESNNE